VLNEFNLYGSSRLGMLTTADTLVCATCTTAVAPSVYLSPVGNKRYELINHLGNVMTVISDKITPIDTTSDGLWDYFNPSLVSATDYYPFGMGMPGRNYNAGNYRHRFSNAEQDNEIKGVGNSLDMKFRIYDPRLGRFLSVDPLVQQFAWNSPYSYAMNRVIDGIDLEGLEYLSSDDARIEVTRGEVKLKVENFNFISRRLWQNANNNPANWTYTNGQKDIGISTTIGNLKYSQANPVKSADPANLNANDENPSANDAQHRVQNPMTKNSNYTQVDKRYKERTIAGGSNIRGTAAKGALALNVLNATVEYGILGAGLYEQYEVNSNLEILIKAIKDVQVGVHQGLVPEIYRNSNDLSSILNVVLQGDSKSDNKELYDIGMNIYNTISNPPKQEEKK